MCFLKRKIERIYGSTSDSLDSLLALVAIVADDDEPLAIALGVSSKAVVKSHI